MYPDLNITKTLLLKENYISEEDSRKAEAVAKDSPGYIDYLIRGQLLSKALLGQALAEYYKIAYVDLPLNMPGKESITIIPEAVARANRAIFLKASDNLATIATDSPDRVNTQELAPLFRGRPIRLVYALPEYIDAAFALYERPLETRFSQIIQAGTRVAPEVVGEILKDALTYHASDIHFEPQPDSVIVRFRVDGTLHEAGKLPKEYYDNILNRIKVECGMRIDEHFTAQDGSIRRTVDKRAVDLRVSLVPTVEGEKAVMRVLGSYIQGFELGDLGLDSRYRELIALHASKPFGMILTVGPTGSGKTTTLYALLKMLNKPNVNITTIEDPVEYKITGTNQIQVREQSGLTFAKGLRAIVRQDPDIILVGEIRDQETADISVNAALTGHILLSTFHANDAATAVPRLIEMGIEPFLLASTLEVVVAQRLVRKICTHCRYSLPAAEAVRALQSNASAVTQYLAKTETVYAGKGCNVCSGTGYSGRTALFEFITVTPDMQDLIIKSPSTREVESLARKQGDKLMFEDGIAKVKAGITTIAEVIRVVALPR